MSLGSLGIHVSSRKSLWSKRRDGETFNTSLGGGAETEGPAKVRVIFTWWEEVQGRDLLGKPEIMV